MAFNAEQKALATVMKSQEEIQKLLAEWDFPICSYICRKHLLLFAVFFFTYINGTSSCKQLVDLNPISYANCLMKKRPKFRNNLDTENMISLLCFARVLGFLALSHVFFWRGVKCWFGSIYEIWIRTGRPNYVKFNLKVWICILYQQFCKLIFINFYAHGYFILCSESFLLYIFADMVSSVYPHI